MKLSSAIFLSILLIASSLPLSSTAQQVARDLQFSSSPNPVGSGARAVGRGGAFIAIADDATAASWNPAGLVQLKYPEASMAVSGLFRNESTDFGSGVVKSDDYNYSTYDLNYFSLAYPTEALPVFMVFSLNYQRLYEFDREVDYKFEGKRVSGPMLIDSKGSVEYDQAGALTTISPALAIEINYRFSVGLSANIWNNSLTPNGWDQRYKYHETGDVTLVPTTYPFTASAEKEDSYRLEGYNYNFNLGFLWDINDTWRVAGVYKSELEADVRHKSKIFTGQYFPTNAALTDYSRDNSSYDETLHLPPSYGVGVAYQPSDAWSFALDVYRTEWQRYILEDEDGNEYNLIAGRVNGHTDVQPTTQVRLGMEYLYIKDRTVYPLRAGLMYDPEPADGKIQDVYGASIGGGWARGRYLVDASLQFRWGQDMDNDVIADQESERDLFECYFLLSGIYHFEKKE